MTDTVWADVSEHNGRPVDLTYPHRALAYRSNDGTYTDALFHANDTAAGRLLARRQLALTVVYFVWRTNWQQTLATLKQQLGTAHRPRTAVMIDVESWNGQIRGDHSSDLNATRAALRVWLTSLRPRWQQRRPFAAVFRSWDRRRVIGYGNVYDLRAIWPDSGDTRFVVASYGSVPTYPGMIAHQYTDTGSCAPWGHPVDLNSADGVGPRRLARRLGLGGLRWTL